MSKPQEQQLLSRVRATATQADELIPTTTPSARSEITGSKPSQFQGPRGTRLCTSLGHLAQTIRERLIERNTHGHLEAPAYERYPQSLVGCGGNSDASIAEDALSRLIYHLRVRFIPLVASPGAQKASGIRLILRGVSTDRTADSGRAATTHTPPRFFPCRLVVISGIDLGERRPTDSRWEGRDSRLRMSFDIAEDLRQLSIVDGSHHHVDRFFKAHHRATE